MCVIRARRASTCADVTRGDCRLSSRPCFTAVCVKGSEIGTFMGQLMACKFPLPQLFALEHSFGFFSRLYSVQSVCGGVLQSSQTQSVLRLEAAVDSSEDPSHRSPRPLFISVSKLKGPLVNLAFHHLQTVLRCCTQSLYISVCCRFGEMRGIPEVCLISGIIVHMPE